LELLTNLSISEQFNVLLQKKIFQITCYVSKKAKNGFARFVICKNISKIRFSISLERLCFTLFSQINGEPDKRYLVDFDANTRNFDYYFIYLGLPNKIKQLYIYFHSRNEYIYYGYDRNYLDIVRTSENNVINFYKTQINLMPKPYQTSCFDYRLKGYHSRDDCIFRCITDGYKNFSGEWPQFYYAFDLNSTLLFEQYFTFWTKL